MTGLPSYTYVPGHTPHPVSSPRGHMRGQAPLDPGHPASWWTGDAFRTGIELFNAGYYWEAHEAWEGTWKSLDRTSAAGQFVKGLIKLAAGGVKCLEANPLGASRHFRRAVELLSVPVTEPWLDVIPVEVSLVRKLAQHLADKSPALTAPSQGLPQSILPGLGRRTQRE